jgi:hypothetical protein
MILRKDLLTGENFYGRINQNFSKSSNRIKYYNNKATIIRHSKRGIDIMLHKNYLIIVELIEKNNNRSYHKEYLLGKGYSFNVYTHLVKYENKQHFAIYDYIILHDEEFNYKFIKYA